MPALERRPVGIRPDLTQRLLEGATYRNPRGVGQTDITICGDKDAQYTTALVYFISGRRDMNLEMITIERSDEVLDADYIYPVGAKPLFRSRTFWCAVAPKMAPCHSKLYLWR